MLKLAEHWKHVLCPFAYYGHISSSCWEAVLKGRGFQDILEEVNLKGAGAGCPHMLKDEPQKEVQGESPSFIGCVGKHSDKG